MLGAYEYKRWYHVHAILDFADNTADVFVDGQPRGKDLPLTPKSAERPMNKFGLVSAYDSTEAKTNYFDNVKFR